MNAAMTKQANGMVTSQVRRSQAGSGSRHGIAFGMGTGTTAVCTGLSRPNPFIAKEVSL